MKLIVNNSNIEFHQYKLIISDEVKQIINHYSDAPIGSDVVLQKFFDSIGDIKDKLLYMTLPMLAVSNVEALYDIVSKTTIHAGDPESSSNDVNFTLANHSLFCNSSGWPKSYFLYTRLSGYKAYQISWASTFNSNSDYRSMVCTDIVNNKLSSAYGGSLSNDSLNNFRGMRLFNKDNSVYGTIFSDTEKSNDFPITGKTINSTAQGSYQLYGSSNYTSGGFTSCVVARDLTESDMIKLREELIKMHNNILK